MKELFYKDLSDNQKAEVTKSILDCSKISDRFKCKTIERFSKNLISKEKVEEII